MNLKDIRLSKISQSQMIPLYRRYLDPYTQKAEWWLPGAGAGGSHESVFNGARVSVLPDEETAEGGRW